MVGIGVVVSLEMMCCAHFLFYSNQLKEQEPQYLASELERLAVIEAVKHFKVHLCNCPFDEYTDYRALTGLLEFTHLNHKLWKWAIFLKEFVFSTIDQERKIRWLTLQKGMADIW